MNGRIWQSGRMKAAPKNRGSITSALDAAGRIKSPARKKRIVEKLIDEHPTLSAPDIAQITGLNPKTAYSYLKEINDNKEVINLFTNAQHDASMYMVMRLLQSITEGDIVRMPAASRIEAAVKLSGLCSDLQQRHAMRDSVRGVIEAVRQRKAGMRLKLTVEASETGTRQGLEVEGVALGGAHPSPPPIIPADIFSDSGSCNESFADKGLERPQETFAKPKGTRRLGFGRVV